MTTKLKIYTVKGPSLSRRASKSICDSFKLDIKPDDVWPVLGSSLKPWRMAVYWCGQYFNREFGYKCGYDYAPEDDESTRAFAWTDSDGRVIGACCFRQREFTNAPRRWVLQWVWFHPLARRKGRLARAWPYFRTVFPNFMPARPFSDAMLAFLRKNDIAYLQWAAEEAKKRAKQP